MKPQRLYHLDLIRAVACIMVIVMHSPLPGSGPALLLSGISLVAAPCIGLFFMVSGALLLPVGTGSSQFLRRRLGKVAGPTLFWTAFYLAVSWVTEGFPAPAELARTLLSVPFSPQGHGILWFMYALIGLYLIAPILSPWLQRASRREVEGALLLWVATLCYPILGQWLTVAPAELNALGHFAGYAGYFLLGYYLRTYSPRLHPALVGLLFVVPLGAAAVCKLGHIEVDFYSVFWYLSIPVAMMCVAWHETLTALFRRLHPGRRVLHGLTTFSNCSFGIYLIHIFIMRNLLWNSELIANRGGVIQPFLTSFLTLTLSFIAVYAIAHLPFAEYIIGYRVKQKVVVPKY